jgi:hypothetical protein
LSDSHGFGVPVDARLRDQVHFAVAETIQ